AEAEFVEQPGPEIFPILQSEVLVPSCMTHWKAGDVRAGGRTKIGNHRRTVIHYVTPKQRMDIGEIVIDADHSTVLTCCAFIGSDQITRSVTIVRPVRSRKKGKKRLHAGINTDGNATVGSGTAASARIAR